MNKENDPMGGAHMSDENNEFGMACPKCRHTDELDVTATIWVRLLHEGDAPFLAFNTDQHWGDDSACRCNHCGWIGTVKEASPEEDDGHPDDAAKRASRVEQLADTMLAMLVELDAGWPWKDLPANLDDIRAEARSLGLLEQP